MTPHADHTAGTAEPAPPGPDTPGVGVADRAEPDALAELLRAAADRPGVDDRVRRWLEKLLGDAGRTETPPATARRGRRNAE